LPCSSLAGASIEGRLPALESHTVALDSHAALEAGSVLRADTAALHSRIVLGPVATASERLSLLAATLASIATNDATSNTSAAAHNAPHGDRTGELGSPQESMYPETSKDHQSQHADSYGCQPNGTFLSGCQPNGTFLHCNVIGDYTEY
jgi:hypothetical protein